jgi:REP element-mobilizing transposase RayT
LARRLLEGQGRRREPVQLEMPAIVNAPVKKPGRGGRRPGAGRKRAPGARPSVPHRARVRHLGRHPVHVTLRLRGGLPSLRNQLVHDMFRAVLWKQRQRRYARAFQVVEFSIQETHLHLIVEAIGRDDAHDALREGMRGLVISLAMRLNRLLRRKGRVWGDRWHGEELRSPNEVRNRLVYVFRQLARHGTRMIGDGLIDVLSSASRFKGWRRPVVPIIDPDSWPEGKPRTWLLGTGWHTKTKGGLLDPLEARRMGP